MQERHVARIDAALHRLQPVRFLHPLGDEALGIGNGGELPFRQRRLHLRRAHIGPQNAAALDQRIGLELDPLAEAAFLRLRRHLDALPGHVVFPAVIGTAQAGLLVAAEPQRHAAMGAELVDQPEPAVAVAERQQPLRQQLHPHRRTIIAGKLLGEQRRQPIAAEQPAARGAGTGLGQEIVLFFSQHRGPSWGVCGRFGMSPARRRAESERDRRRRPAGPARAPARH